MKYRTLVVALLFASTTFAQNTKPAPKGLHWQPWSDSVFVQAKSSHRFVLLDLEAVWCHWCHVMEATTYKDPKVIALLNSKYLLVRADQDARPDLSSRYEDYGWPATVVFDGEGHEIVKRQGYLDPKQMASMLQAIMDDPTPGPSVQPEAKIAYPLNPLLPEDLRKELKKDYVAGYDPKQGSWGLDQKYLDWDSVEYSMDLAALGDAQAEHMARQTLTAQLQLVDPVWGGVYQYSTDGVWTAPHFEKIMSMQAENLRTYSQAYARWHDPAYLQAAQSIRNYLKTFLTSTEGAFYTSQDADLVQGEHSAEYFRLDDKERRKLGVPRVDTHIYSRENGWAIAALATFYGATGDQQALEDAVRAAHWVMQHRAIASGGFRHDSKDAAGPYLGDTLAMTRAFLALYGATGDRSWLAAAQVSALYVDRTFRNSSGAGYLTAASNTDHSYKSHPQRDENASVVRITNQLFQYTGNENFKKIRETAMRYLAAEPVATRLPVATTLLADFEATRPPLHLTVVGHKDDPAAQALFRAFLQYPAAYKRLEWWDTREGKLPNPDVQYPSLSKAAAYVCTERTCSSPIFNPADIPIRVPKILGVQATAQYMKP